ncbi:MAG: hypothetical protein IKQ41_11935 [Clostridia bacterium]|nr:hypothetical protein [Clostridia bacterium]
MTADILLTHFERYPRMEAQDAVKLIYQNEFGPGHLIRDEAKSLKMLEEEMANLSADAKEALYEPIGNGLCRLNLRACLSRGITAADVSRLLSETAKGVTGDKKRFWLGVRVLQELADADETPFEPVLLDLFLARYPKTCPPMHHSEMYSRIYQPAYRVISQKRVKDYMALRRAKEQE